jgi:hypothetical protein
MGRAKEVMTTNTGEKMDAAESSLTPRRFSWERAFFAGCLVVFLAAHLALVGSAILQRSVPLEPQDAYSYIVKAAQLGDCFFQNCPALNDLREQLTPPSADEDVAWIRYRQRQRIFPVYSPLYSVLLAALHGAGLTWETSYAVAQLAGLVFVGGAVGFFLLVLWGPMAGGIALLFLAITIFADQGIHYLVPSNLVMGIALWVWAYIARTPPPAGKGPEKSPRGWVVFVALLLMLATHALGRVYGIVTLFYYWLMPGRTPRRQLALISIVTVALIAFVSLLPSIVTRPDFTLLHDPLPAQWNRLHAMIQTIPEILHKATYWLGRRRGDDPLSLMLAVLALAPLLLAGFLTESRDRQRRMLLMAIPLVLFPFTDVAFPHPRYPALLFSRLWIPLAILLTGAFGKTVLTLAQSLLQSNCRRSLLRKPSSPPLSQANELPTTLGPFCSPKVFFPLAMALVVYAVLALPGKIDLIRRASYSLNVKGDSALDRSQAALLRQVARPGDRVLYMHEPTTLFFLTHAGFDLGAVYYPAVRGTAEEAFWMAADKNLRFIAGYNPFVQIPIRKGRGLRLSGDRRIELAFSSPTLVPALRLHVVNADRDSALRIRWTDAGAAGEQSVEAAVPRDFNDWLTPSTRSPSLASRIVLDVPGAGTLSLEGIRMNESSRPNQDQRETNWPWDRGISLVYKDPTNATTQPITVRFESANLHPHPGHRIEVLSDSGSTVLARIAE